MSKDFSLFDIPYCACDFQEFPLKSGLDPKEFGDPTSAIAAHHIEGHLEGLSIEQVAFAFLRTAPSIPSCAIALRVKCRFSYHILILCLSRLCLRRNSSLRTTMTLIFHSWRESTHRRIPRHTPPEHCFSCRVTIRSRFSRLSWFFHHRHPVEQRNLWFLHPLPTHRSPITCGKLPGLMLPTTTLLHIKFSATGKYKPAVTSSCLVQNLLVLSLQIVQTSQNPGA